MNIERKQRYKIVFPTAVLSFIIFFIKPSLKNLPSLEIAVLLGQTLGIIAVTYSISLVLEGRISKYLLDMNIWRKKYRNTFLLTWAIFMSIHLIGYYYDPINQVKIKEDFEYSPKESAFKVVFSEKPTIKETSSLIDGEMKKSETAELTTGNSFQRTELCYIDQARSSTYNKDNLYEVLIQYSKLNGLSFPDFNYEENKFGKTASVRGFKTISERKITYLLKIYILDTTLLIMSVGCLSEEFPTSDISSFLKSISLKN